MILNPAPAQALPDDLLRHVSILTPNETEAELLTGIEGQQPRPGRRGGGCSFAPRCSFAVGRCSLQTPEAVSIGGRTVRCLRVAEIGSDAAARPAALARPAATGAPAVLSLRDMSASYGHTPVLFGVGLDVPAESCVAVVGESGSGKTTLARCIAGLHRDWTGEMSFQGAPLAAGARQRPKDVLKRVQYIFQNPYTSLNPRKTIGQIVGQPLEQFLHLGFKERTERIARVLDDVSLSRNFMSQYPDQLSGGERQRVAIARALVVEPDLLICDEVTSALDVSVQAVIVELLRRLQRERQLAMIFITHNLALVRNIAQSAVVLCNGAVVESGPVEQILEHPADPYTIRLISDIPQLAIAGLTGRPAGQIRSAVRTQPASRPAAQPTNP